MHHRIFSLFIFLLLHFQIFSQEATQFSLSENFIETTAGQQVVVKLTKPAVGQIVMHNAPKGAVLSGQQFRWVVPEAYENAHVTVEFYLYDSAVLLGVKSLFIKINRKLSPPKLDIRANIEAVDGLYYLRSSVYLELHAVGYSSFDSAVVVLEYFFNDDENIKEINGASVTIAQSTLTFAWTPTQEQLNRKYFSLTIAAKDENDQTFHKTILFVLIKENQSPYFKYPVLDEYYITANEALEIDLTTIDPDGDSLAFNLTIPTSIGQPKLTGNGKFIWRLNEDEIRRIRNLFPLEVKVEVAETGTQIPITVTKRLLIRRSEKNQPPKILNLQNETIFEGLLLKKTIFIQDNNDDFSDLSVQIIGAPDGMTWEVKDNAVTIEWMPSFDVIGVEMQAEKFDMLLVVKDPHGYVDQQAFTINVLHRENTEITYETYLDYRDEAIILIENLAQMHIDLEIHEDRSVQTKKTLAIITMLFAAYTAGGGLYEDGSVASNIVPLVGIMAAVAGSINAFGFNDVAKFGSLKEQIFLLQQKLIYIQAILSEYKISSANSPNLENKEFRSRLETYEQWMVQDKLNFKSYYNNYRNLNYVKRQMTRQTKAANKLSQKPEGLLFLDLSGI